MNTFHSLHEYSKFFFAIILDYYKKVYYNNFVRINKKINSPLFIYEETAPPQGLFHFFAVLYIIK